jgi:DNA-binding NarL/FixJ family response regulator
VAVKSQGTFVEAEIVMSARCRILIAKQSSRGLSALLKRLDPRQADVVAFYDVPPRLDRKFGETDVDICLIDLKMLQRVLKSHPDCVSRIRQSGVLALILNGKHLSKARQFSDKVDGFVLLDHLLDFINESLLLSRQRHCVVPSGMLSPLAVLNMRLASFQALSAAEKRILPHLAAARTNQAIAARMTISEATVKALVRSVRLKLGLLNRTEAALFAVSQNLSAAAKVSDSFLAAVAGD